MDPGTALVGREQELRALDEALARVVARAPAALRLAGEPGIGKTRLLEALALQAEARRFTVLTGRASEYESDLPFGVFIDALDAFVATLDASRRRALGADRLATLAGVFASLADDAGHAVARLQEERHRTHGAIRALLELIAAPRPMLLVLDDVHWADEASLELLGHLLRRRPAGSVALAVAYRPGEAPEPLRRALEGLTPSDVALTLGPLDEDAAARLTGLGRWRDADLYRISGGNPFYLLQLARTGADDVAGLATPETIRTSLARELRRASEGAARIARAASVVGEPFTPELVAAAATVPEDEVLAAIDELVALDLVRPGDAPREFRFRHPLVRQAVYENSEVAWRLGAHERVAAFLERQGASLERRALHVERCAREGDEAAIALLTQAGHARASVAPSSAARWFEAALRLLPHDAGASRRMELLVPLATVHGSSGRLAESRDALRRLLAELPEELAFLRTQVIGFIAMAEHQLGHHAAATAILQDALAELPRDASADAAGLRSELAGDAFYRGDFTAMLQWSREGLAEPLDEPALEACLRAQLALAHYSLGEMAEAEVAYAQAAATVAALPDETLAGRVFALAWLSWYGQSADRQEEGVAHAERGIAICRATGQGHLLVPLTIGRAIGLTWLGRLAEAAATAEDAVEMAHLAANDQYLAWTATLRCWIHGIAGETELAVAAGERAVQHAARTNDNLFTTLAACYAGEARLEAGDAPGCREQILAVGAELEPVEWPFRPRFYEVLTRAELAAGDLEAAEGWARRAWTDAEGPRIPGRLGEALRARAAVALAAGRPAEAAALAREAAEAAAAADLRVEAGRGHLLAGRALAAAGDAESAVAELRTAAETCSARGALRLRDEAAGALRALGRRARVNGRRDRVARPGGLSARQLEIARLVAAGNTNREIASRLFLSERTVETHLANVFDKLGVRSRAAVAAAIARDES